MARHWEAHRLGPREAVRVLLAAALVVLVVPQRVASGQPNGPEAWAARLRSLVLALVAVAVPAPKGMVRLVALGALCMAARVAAVQAVLRGMGKGA
jgi:hypothetical protein